MLISSLGGVTMSAANKLLMEDWFEKVWNQQNAAAIDAMLSPDCRSHGFPRADSVLIGPEEFKAIHRNFCGAFPDLLVTVEDVIAEGDKAAVRFTATMTHLGDFLGMKATQKEVELHGCKVVIIKDGMISEGWDFMDMGGMLATLRAE
jgi:steroid delta-isomerase-like uncharacterized protein